MYRSLQVFFWGGAVHASRNFPHPFSPPPQKNTNSVALLLLPRHQLPERPAPAQLNGGPGPLRRVLVLELVQHALSDQVLRVARARLPVCMTHNGKVSEWPGQHQQSCLLPAPSSPLASPLSNRADKTKSWVKILRATSSFCLGVSPYTSAVRMRISAGKPPPGRSLCFCCNPR